MDKTKVFQKDTRIFMKELQKIIRKNRPDGPILKQCKGDFGMEYLTFPTLEDTGIV